MLLWSSGQLAGYWVVLDDLVHVAGSGWSGGGNWATHHHPADQCGLLHMEVGFQKQQERRRLNAQTLFKDSSSVMFAYVSLA